MSSANQSYHSFDDPSKKKKKVPKRILHFSDGILEEYSTDEEEREEIRKQEAEKEASKAVVNTSEMSWTPWFIYLAWVAATSTFQAADSLGEKLAWWLGITSPKYYYEIQEAKRMLKEEEKKKIQDAEMAGWVGDSKEGIVESQEAVRSKVLGLEES